PINHLAELRALLLLFIDHPLELFQQPLRVRQEVLTLFPIEKKLASDLVHGNSEFLTHRSPPHAICVASNRRSSSTTSNTLMLLKRIISSASSAIAIVLCGVAFAPRAVLAAQGPIRDRTIPEPAVALPTCRRSRSWCPHTSSATRAASHRPV